VLLHLVYVSTSGLPRAIESLKAEGAAVQSWGIRPGAPVLLLPT
jgi:hypothetical protein